MRLVQHTEIGAEDAHVDDRPDCADESDLEAGAASVEPDASRDPQAAARATARAAGRSLRRTASFGLRVIRAMVARWRLLSLVTAAAAAVALAGTLFLLQYRPIQQTDGAAERAAIKAASEGSVALLSYSPESLDNDIAAGKAHLTGELLRYFSGFSKYFVAPSVRQQQVRASASVLRAAIADMHPNSAVVLVFVHQTTSSRDKPDPVLTTNSVRVTLTKDGGSWLIAKFEPE
jgi:Mce-associated membrane protein